MKKYLAVFRIRFINALQYRAAAAAGVATQFAWGFLEIFAFSAFYRANPNAFPMEFSHTVSYIWLQQAFLALFMMWFWESDVTEAIEGGAIAYELIRPMDLYKRWFAQSCANRSARALLRCAPILLIAFIVPKPYRMGLPPSLPQFTMFVISSALSLGVVVATSMLAYVSIFYTLSSTGIRSVFTTIVGFLAGEYIPIPFFPPSIRAIAELLPFAAMQNMPLRIYSGNIAGRDALWGLAFQVFWLSLLIVLGRLAMNRALKRVVVQGG
ncbi:MAG: ABC transporter permease [Oscillospiraceae bacterium]|nr:ABC transporter permease [Oscillospiraceae bacterium]